MVRRAGTTSDALLFRTKRFKSIRPRELSHGLPKDCSELPRPAPVYANFAPGRQRRPRGEPSANGLKPLAFGVRPCPARRGSGCPSLIGGARMAFRRSLFLEVLIKRPLTLARRGAVDKTVSDSGGHEHGKVAAAAGWRRGPYLLIVWFCVMGGSSCRRRDCAGGVRRWTRRRGREWPTARGALLRRGRA